MAKRQSVMAGSRASIVLVALLVALALPALAQAASRPTVSTGSAKQVSFGSALLTGSVNPNGANTSYYFQYGPTRALGFQSAIADAETTAAATPGRPCALRTNRVKARPGP